MTLMTKTQKAQQLIESSKHNISVQLVLRRMREGWSDKRIVETPPLKKPQRHHPHKAGSYQAMLERLGRES